MIEQRRLTLAIGFIALSAMSAFAEGASFGTYNNALRIAVQPQVKRDLKLTNEQVEQIKAITQKSQSRLGEVNRKVKELSVEKRADATQMEYRKIAEEIKKELDILLSAEQLQRLRGLTYQRMKGDAFQDADVRDELKLTEEQKTKIDEILLRKQKKVAEVSNLMSNPATRQRAADLAKTIDKEQLDSLLTLLNDAQKKKWLEILGPPANPG